jgi:hypothetical protein
VVLTNDHAGWHHCALLEVLFGLLALHTVSGCR